MCYRDVFAYSDKVVVIEGNKTAVAEYMKTFVAKDGWEVNVGVSANDSGCKWHKMMATLTITRHPTVDQVYKR